MICTRRALLAAVVGWTAACRPAPKPETKTIAVGWRPLGSWSGRGNTQTESFNVETGQFRIRWETAHESSPGAGTFRVTVHSAVSGRPLLVAVDHRGPGHDTALVTDDPRLYHLVIESSGIDWSVQAEEAVVGEVPAAGGSDSR